MSEHETLPAPGEPEPDERARIQTIVDRLVGLVVPPEVLPYRDILFLVDGEDLIVYGRRDTFLEKYGAMFDTIGARERIGGVLEKIAQDPKLHTKVMLPAVLVMPSGIAVIWLGMGIRQKNAGARS